MTKSIDPLFKIHLSRAQTNVATCWRVTRLDGNVLGFTDHDKDILGNDIAGSELAPGSTVFYPPGTGGLDPDPDAPVADTLIYRANAGYNTTDVASNANLDVDNLDIQGLLISDSITEEDLRAGLWDGATIEIFEVNWRDLSQGLMWMRKGRLGKVTKGRNQWKAELLGMMYIYQTSIIQITQPGCRATFGDIRCKITPETQSGVIDEYDSPNMTLYISDRAEADGYFNFGKVQFTSGQNAGVVCEIRVYVVGATRLQSDPPYIPQPGDTYLITRGCGKSWDTWCRDTYDNLLNFRGEPHLLGNDILIQVGRRRS